MPSTYTRKMPPFIARCFFGVFMFVVLPVVWLLQKLGLTARVAGRMISRQRRMVEAKNPFRGYTPTAHDVFVATFAKSGTNWMMQIAHQLAFHGNADFTHIHDVVPWPDTKIMGPMRNYAIPVEDPSVWMASPEKKRIIKTHFNWELLPYSEAARYIMVIRDPKDIFVSSYFFFVKNSGVSPATLPVETFVEMFLSENFPVSGSWAVSTAGYWAQRHRPNVLVCSFKAMRRDLLGTVRQVADFLDIHASEEVIARVCEKSTFEYMKRVDDKFRVSKMIPWGREGPMIRRGAQGGSSELLTPEQQRRLDQYFVAELTRLGSDFPYAEFCDPSS